MALRSSVRRLRRRLGIPARRSPSPAQSGRVAKVPPEIPEGWTVGPPDFIGIGVQKAGTTWWWTLLAAHPDMVGRIKETHHLARFGWRPLDESDVRSYHRLFPRRPGSITGEWTPRYMALAGLPDAIRACAPQAKLLAVLRDPLERYRSGVGEWRKRKIRLGKPLDLDRGTKDAFVRSFYAFELQRYVEAFGRHQLLALQLERCRADPLSEYRRTLDFLGLRPWDPPAELLGNPVNVTRAGKADPTEAERAGLVAALEKDVLRLRTMVPELDLRLWPNFRHLSDG